MSQLDLRKITATSATLAESMRACLLRAGLSRATGISTFVLGSPKAWLGTAYHEVLEKIVEIDLRNEPLETAVDRLWSQAIGSQEQRADAHALNRRFGPPTTWPGYYVARASVLLRSQGLALGPGPTIAVETTESSLHESIREQEFVACGGKLVGRPDVIRADEVVDYKSGAIVEHDDLTQTEVVKAAYVRQLRIYGFLVNHKLGWWPARGILLPLAGPGVEVALDPIECAREATEAVELLDAYNGMISATASVSDLASPSPQGCRWCPYKVLCPAFWRDSLPEWSGQLDGAAVEGVLVDAPSAIHAGVARAIALDIQGGSEVRRRAQIAPLNPVAHPSVVTLAAGECVRIVGLRARSDGVLAPTQRTVLSRVADLPTVVLAGGAA